MIDQDGTHHLCCDAKEVSSILPLNIFAIDEVWLRRAPSEVPPSSLALNGVLLVHEKEAIEAALAHQAANGGEIEGAHHAAIAH